MPSSWSRVTGVFDSTMRCWIPRRRRELGMPPGKSIQFLDRLLLLNRLVYIGASSMCTCRVVCGVNQFMPQDKPWPNCILYSILANPSIPISMIYVDLFWVFVPLKSSPSRARRCRAGRNIVTMLTIDQRFKNGTAGGAPGGR